MQHDKDLGDRIKVGDDVVVWWLDSGAGNTERPDKDRPVHLWIKKTHGEVLSLEEDEDLAERLPHGFSSKTLVLAMCSANQDDSGSDLAAIWVPAITKIRVMPKEVNDLAKLKAQLDTSSDTLQQSLDNLIVRRVPSR